MLNHRVALCSALSRLSVVAAVAALVCVPQLTSGAGAADSARCTGTSSGFQVCSHLDPPPPVPLPTDVASLRARAAWLRDRLPGARSWLAHHHRRLATARPARGWVGHARSWAGRTGPLAASDGSSGGGTMPTSTHVRPGCTGDGTSGDRVQVVYAVPQGRPDRFSTVRSVLVEDIAHVDDVFLASAAQTGGALGVRWVTNPDCSLDIARTTISSAAETSFAQMRTELVAAGFDRPDRKYLVLVDTPLTGICGIAEEMIDDRPTGNANDSDVYTQFARVDAQCWTRIDHSTEAHEIVHTLGGVQRTAPDATPYGHCTDESDTMCYVDGAGVTMRQVCPPANEGYLDCNHNDYFSTAPPAGSYLATHWNTANSTYLAPPAAPEVSATAPSTVAAGEPFRLSAALDVPSGQVSTLHWSVPGCTVTDPSAASTSAACPVGDTQRTSATVTVRQADGQTATATAVVSPQVAATPTTPTVALRAPWRVGYHGRARVVATVRDGGLPVAGLPVTLRFRPAHSRAVVRLGRLTTDAAGQVLRTVRLSRPGTFTVDTAAVGSFATARAGHRVALRYRTRAVVVAPAHARRRHVVRALVRLVRQDGHAVRHGRVVLFYRGAGSHRWRVVGVSRTGWAGRVAFRTRLPATGFFRAVFRGGALLRPARSRRVLTRAW